MTEYYDRLINENCNQADFWRIYRLEEEQLTIYFNPYCNIQKILFA